MAIMPGDIEFYYSTGATGASEEQTDPQASLGGAIATNVVTGNINNVLDDITLEEATTGRVEYRMLYVKNAHPDQTIENAVIWMVSTGQVLDIALDPAPVGSPSTKTIPSETTAPTGITFAGIAVSLATALVIGDIGPGEIKAFWEKCTIAAGATNSRKRPEPRVEGDGPL